VLNNKYNFPSTLEYTRRQMETWKSMYNFKWKGDECHENM